MEPDRAWKAGDRSITPSGRLLPGVRSDGLWSRTFRSEGSRPIAESISGILDQLLPHKELFRRLDRIGARSALYLQLPGDTNNGDRFDWTTLKKFTDLRIAFEFETFPEWT